MSPWDEYQWDMWDMHKEPLPEKVSRFRRISLCTTCMGRLRDLQQTLPQNIIDNCDYPNLEFVILDYNSNDGLADWIRSAMAKHLQSGLLAYFRTEEPEFYEMGHSRNVAFKVATGEIVNNLDADNFTNQGFAAHLNRQAEICPERAVFAKGKRQLHGRIGFYRREFLELGGYDEELTGYGADDIGLLHRAMNFGGFKLMWWGGQYYRRLKTPSADKVANMRVKSWRQTEKANQAILAEKAARGILVANSDRHWGKARLVHNFSRVIDL